MRFFVWAGAVAILAACNSSITQPPPPPPVLSCRDTDTLPTSALFLPRDRYLVTLRGGVVASTALGYSPERVYRAFAGFRAPLTAAHAAMLRRDPRVVAVERDRLLTPLDTQFTAPWGLDRSDQRKRDLDSLYVYDATGEGVTVYVLDTGILVEHSEFEGRASRGFDAIQDANPACHGHGTHVAGIIGSRTFGVAKRVQLVDVRVLDCSGAGLFSQVIEGLDWIVQQPVRPALVNVSLGSTGVFEALEAAVRGVLDAGLPVIMAAGNNSGSACDFTPAREPRGVTVGAIDETARVAPFSNLGPCLDLWAPGVRIISTWNVAPTREMNGTSMAAPHVSGTAALYLEHDPTLSPAAVGTLLVDQATRNLLVDADSTSPDRVLYSLLTASIPHPPNPPPPVNPADIVAHVAGFLTARNEGRDSVGPVWYAQVAVLVHDASGNPLSGVLVTGLWDRGAQRQGQCLTTDSGYCELVTPPLSCAYPRVALRVAGLSGPRILFDVRASPVLDTAVIRP